MRNSKRIQIGNMYIGNRYDIAIQSMLNVSPDDLEGNIRQAKELENAGCDIIRVAIPNMRAVNLISLLKENIKIPIVADIHFNYKLAIESVAAGADKIRINPGNIGGHDKIRLVSGVCNHRNIPIRIGVNAGSLEKNILQKYNMVCPEALCESALYNISLLEKYDFNNIVVSIKSSNVKETIDSYRMISEKTSYPLHVGITESGTEKIGIIKSAIGIGSLLSDGIGDTIRVSLTADPIKEIYAAQNILKSLNMNKKGVIIISCPTCGRTKIDIIKLTNQLEKLLANYEKKLKIAVMGCVVNGPGEAYDADIGICGGDGIGIIFKKGKIIKRVEEQKLIEELLNEIKTI